MLGFLCVTFCHFFYIVQQLWGLFAFEIKFACLGWFIVMIPSKAGWSHSSSWKIFSSALFGLRSFSLQLEIENWPKTSQKQILSFWLFLIINLFWKWLDYAVRSYYSTLKTPFVLIKLDKQSWNWSKSCCRSKLGNLI